MKFLVDNQLPIALCRFIETRNHVAVHVLDLKLEEAPDLQIWQHVEQNNLVLISKDEDFLHHANNSRSGALVWVRLPNCRNQVLITAFEKALPGIVASIESGQRVIEMR